MPCSLATGANVARSLSSGGHVPSVWIPDQLLTSVFRRYIISHAYAFQGRRRSNNERNGAQEKSSTVHLRWSPDYSHRHLDMQLKRNRQAPTNGSEIRRVSPQPVPSPVSATSKTAKAKPSGPGKSSHLTERSEAANALPAKSFGQEEKSQGTSTQDEDVASKETGVKTTRPPNILSEVRVTALQGESARCLAESHNLIATVPQDLYFVIRRKTLEYTNNIGNESIGFKQVERIVDSVLASTSIQQPLVVGQLRLIAYDCLWQFFDARTGTLKWDSPYHYVQYSPENHTQLFLDLLDRIASMQSSQRSRDLLKIMMRNVSGVRVVLTRSQLVSKISLHFLHESKSGKGHDREGVEALDLCAALESLPFYPRHAWIKQSSAAFRANCQGLRRIHGEVKFARCMREWLNIVQHLLPSDTEAIDDAWRALALVQDPVHVINQLSQLSDERFWHLVANVWIPIWDSAGVTWHRPNLSQLEDRDNNLETITDANVEDASAVENTIATMTSNAADREPAMELISNTRFTHLAPYFELIHKTRRDSIQSAKCVAAMLELFLKQNRPDDFAFVVYRLHRSPTFSPLIPQQTVQQWINTYSGTHPHAAVRLSKICTSPITQIADLFIDLIRSPGIRNRALDFLVWREISKDRAAWLQESGLNAHARDTKNLRVMRPRMIKLLHALSIAYAREPRFDAQIKFQRIYRLYRHMILRGVQVHPLVGKLLTLTGAIVPTLQGVRVDGRRLQFLVRVQTRITRLPPQQDLWLLGRLNEQARMRHACLWADEVYGPNWRRWVGWQGRDGEDAGEGGEGDGA